MQDRVILHCDVNNFYAQVETLFNPELKDKPVAVCGDPALRHGIVLAKSEAAKAFGVKTAEPIWQALRKCPKLIIVPPTYKKYAEFSKIIYDICTSFTDEVESFGMDECWLDVTGSRELFGTGVEIAYQLKDKIKQLTGLTVSIGVSFSKIFAKLGSDLKKPDAVSIISRENYKSVAWKLPVSDMLYIGKRTEKKLFDMGIESIGDLALADRALIFKIFGKNGLKMCDAAKGEDKDRVKSYTEKHIPESIGNGATCASDITNTEEAASLIFSLAEIIGFRLRTFSLSAGGVSVNLRDKNLTFINRQKKFMPHTSDAYRIGKYALEILEKSYDFNTMPPLRTITIGTYDLIDKSGEYQKSFFDDETDKGEKLSTSLDKLRNKYGFGILKRAVCYSDVFTCDSREIEDDFLDFKH